MRIEYLKVKSKSLAAEAKIIRKEEQRVLRRSRWERKHNKGDPQDSLWCYEGLRFHRTKDLRPEARHTYLALGFLRGKPYERVEVLGSTKPDWDAVQRMIEKYGGKDLVQKFCEWKTGADQPAVFRAE